MKTEDKRKLGKASRAAGQRFELKVRHDLESKGWIVSKWGNNVDFIDRGNLELVGKIIPAKHKYNFFTKAMTAGNGFPDFICVKINGSLSDEYSDAWEVQLVESKMAGKLDKEEKEKIEWLKKNIKIPCILAKKGEKGEVIYEQQ